MTTGSKIVKLSDMVQKITVDSAAIKEITYDFADYRLQVLWQNDRIGSYLDVPKGLFLKLCTSESKGRFLVKEIKPYYIYRGGL